jgi:hypothetical protein
MTTQQQSLDVDGFEGSLPGMITHAGDRSGEISLRRIVRGAALVTVCSITNAGCGADRPPRDQSAARLTAAVLSQRDMPSDFLPADDQQVFSRVEPADPDCRRLLVLADLRGLRDVPNAASTAPPQVP